MYKDLVDMARILLRQSRFQMLIADIPLAKSKGVEEGLIEHIREELRQEIQAELTSSLAAAQCSLEDMTLEELHQLHKDWVELTKKHSLPRSVSY